MICPKCGYIYRTRFAEQLVKFIGLGVCMAGAVVGQAELIGEPWRHYVTVGFVLGTAYLGWITKKGNT